MSGDLDSAEEKALKINLDAARYGTFAEIGAGQEVARWFFQAGKAASTVAKTISAYDKSVSDALYGTTSRFVSRARLESMLDCEYRQLLDQAEGNLAAVARHLKIPRTTLHHRLIALRRKCSGQ